MKPTLRSEIRSKNLWHRASYVFVTNSQKEVLIHLRAAHLDYCPGQWDLCAGGCIEYGETDFHNAKRELHEEYGIDTDDIVAVGSHRYVDATTK